MPKRRIEYILGNWIISVIWNYFRLFKTLYKWGFDYLKTMGALGGGAFSWLRSAAEERACMGVLGMEEITISTSAVEIGRLAFPSCENLRHVDFGETGSLGAISLEAFPNADLEEVVLPQGVETIEDSAFAGNNGLAVWAFPSTVRWIGDRIAYGARNLTEATYQGNMQEWEAIEKDPNWFNITSCQVVHCQDGEVQIG